MRRYIQRWFIHLTAGAVLASTTPLYAEINRSSHDSQSQRPSFTGAANLPLSADLAIHMANEPIRVSLGPVGEVNSARVTFYDPDINSAMEGGGRDRYGERINSIEDAAENGRPVSIAADVYGSFGAACNRSSSRCLILISADGFDSLFPQYRAHFPNLPPNSFIGIIEDTGGAFFGKGTKRLDLAARNAHLARSAPSRFNSNVHWVRLENPCGSGSAGRRCDFSETSLAPSMLAMLNIR